MGELARQRDALDLWVSRSHLWAMATGTLVLALTTLALGFLIGRKTAPEKVVTQDLGDAQLADVLARVRGSNRSGVEEITFHDSLAGGAQPALMEVPTGAEAAASLTIATAGGASVGDVPPVEPYTLLIADLPGLTDATALRDRLRGANLPAWIAVLVVNGKPMYQVAIGGFADANEAQAKLTEFDAALRATGLTGKVGPTPNASAPPTLAPEAEPSNAAPEADAG